MEDKDKIILNLSNGINCKINKETDMATEDGINCKINTETDMATEEGSAEEHDAVPQVDFSTDRSSTSICNNLLDQEVPSNLTLINEMLITVAKQFLFHIEVPSISRTVEEDRLGNKKKRVLDDNKCVLDDDQRFKDENKRLKNENKHLKDENMRLQYTLDFLVPSDFQSRFKYPSKEVSLEEREKVESNNRIARFKFFKTY